MNNEQQQRIRRLLGPFFRFLLRVVRGFMHNQGLLLSGALAYYTLLSIIPMSIIFLTGLSHFIAEDQLLHTLSTYTGMIIPGYSRILAEQVQVFLEHRQAVGIIGFLAMLFFSSMAFGGASKRPGGYLFQSGQNQPSQFPDFRCHSLSLCRFNRAGHSRDFIYYGILQTLEKSNWYCLD